MSSSVDITLPQMDPTSMVSVVFCQADIFDQFSRRGHVNGSRPLFPLHLGRRSCGRWRLSYCDFAPGATLTKKNFGKHIGKLWDQKKTNKAIMFEVLCATATYSCAKVYTTNTILWKFCFLLTGFGNERDLPVPILMVLNPSKQLIGIVHPSRILFGQHVFLLTRLPWFLGRIPTWLIFLATGLKLP